MRNINNETIIIESAEDFKDPFYVYCAIHEWMKEAGEDYVDYNEDIVKPYPFIMWLHGKGLITSEQLDKLLAENELCLQEIICGWEILFPNTYGKGYVSEFKSYWLLSNYISICEIFRKRFYDSLYDNIYIDEEGISPACKIPYDMLKSNPHTLEEVKHLCARDTFNWTYKESYNFVESLSIEETDFDLVY